MGKQKFQMTWRNRAMRAVICHWDFVIGIFFTHALPKPP